ncbi:pyridoxamine 5'-phosphate oxidase family protein [Nocardia yunnanensis]|uniref:Pyridoxamine 5'-phosphate oxidase family protein n=1 Tax=Nocardia yunnanensis TaxID=2382165 RepID=A0A386ZFZ0_9NOCA|nr:pyridoxamine 5'-phosphate oxidase family protein [Nocardia yunnanensis]AYF75419.1 pyridoxamine 5'-phosphate oxidase family protein [Nocardia yunnanensis]
MTSWTEFVAAAPRVSTVFSRRLAATGNLCLLATLRKDGFPRICPIEPRVFEGQLWVSGMPHTRKFADLARDPRFSLHTATVDTHVGDGDAKVFGTVHDVRDPDLHQRYAEDLYATTGFDLRGRTFEPFYAADLLGASSIEIVDGRTEVTIWKPGRAERTVDLHAGSEDS